VHSCAVLVVSSDGYKDLWGPFFSLFRKYWPDCPFPVYLGTQTLEADIDGVTTLLAGPDESPPLVSGWSGSLRRFLNQLDSGNVLLMLEDFFLSKTVSTANVLEQLAALRSLGGTVLRLNPSPPPTIKAGKDYPGIGEQHRLAPFRVSLQVSIWNRQGLLALLRDGESPWAFEIKGTFRSQEQPGGFYCTLDREIQYWHVVEQGQWFWAAARHYRRKNIGCDFKAREVMDPFTATRKILLKGLRRSRERLLMLPLRSRELDPYFPLAPTRTLRVAFLTNLLPPYHKPLFHLLDQRLAAFRVLLSTPMEANRPWKVDWGGLDVVLQRTYTAKGWWRHPRGFREPLAVHIPIDTLQQLRRFSPDVIISVEMGARTLLAMLFRRLNPRCRLLIWVETAGSGESSRGLARHLVRKILIRNADAFLAVGTNTVQYLQRLGAPAGRIFKVAYATDAERFAMNVLTRPKERAHRLLFCGQLVDRKGLLPFVRVLCCWANDHPERNVEFVLAGDGPLHNELVQFPLPPNVKLEFLGVVQYDDLPEIYASAGVLVFPTLAETWGVVVNEALGAGLPVLGSVYAPAVEELIQEGYNGWIFRPDNVDDSYRAVDRMMNTPAADLERMRANARAVACELSPQRVAAVIGNAISSCAGAA
jgi:glycosyltransferase involved in cell wall biosynthesis